jgi:hypothetical protein
VEVAWGHHLARLLPNCLNHKRLLFSLPAVLTGLAQKAVLQSTLPTPPPATTSSVVFWFVGCLRVNRWAAARATSAMDDDVLNEDGKSSTFQVDGFINRGSSF